MRIRIRRSRPGDINFVKVSWLNVWTQINGLSRVAHR